MIEKCEKCGGELIEGVMALRMECVFILKER